MLVFLCAKIYIFQPAIVYKNDFDQIHIDIFYDISFKRLFDYFVLHFIMNDINDLGQLPSRRRRKL